MTAPHAVPQQAAPSGPLPPEAFLGAFARIFPSGTAAELAQVFLDSGLTQVQLNLSALGYPTIPTPDQLAQIDLAGIAAAFTDRGRIVWGVSATYNTAHPDERVRATATADAAHFIAALGSTGAVAATLCTGTRDPDDMWRAHPGNNGPEAWTALHRSLQVLLPAAETAGVLLAVEPEPGNVVADTARAQRLVHELGAEGDRIGFILDPANLVSAHPRERHTDILREAFAALGDRTICVHAKDAVAWADTLDGAGVVDYDLVAELYRALPRRVPFIIQDATPEQVPRIEDLLRSRLTPSGPSR